MLQLAVSLPAVPVRDTGSTGEVSLQPSVAHTKKQTPVQVIYFGRRCFLGSIDRMHRVDAACCY